MCARLSAEIRIDIIRKMVVREKMGFRTRETRVQKQPFDLLAVEELQLLICKCGKFSLHHETVARADGEPKTPSVIGQSIIPYLSSQDVYFFHCIVIHFPGLENFKQ